MNKKLLLITAISILTTVQASASTPFNWCMTELIHTRDKVMSIAPESIEVVDGYNDIDSIKNVEHCVSELSESEGLLVKACEQFLKTDSLVGFYVYLNPKIKKACKDIDLYTHSIVDQINRTKAKDPELSAQEKESNESSQQAIAR